VAATFACHCLVQWIESKRGTTDDLHVADMRLRERQAVLCTHGFASVTAVERSANGVEG
jgi:hypothetical protein